MAKIETKLSAAQVAIAEALFGGTYAVTLGKKAGTPTSVPVPVAGMPEAAIVKMFAYGVQRTFNDANGGSDTSLDEKVAGVKEMIADFLEGKVARSRASGEAVDPLVAEIRVLLRSDYKDAWTEENGKDGWKAREEDDIVAGIDALFESQDDETKAAITALAQESLDAKARKAAAKKTIVLKKA